MSPIGDLICYSALIDYILLYFNPNTINPNPKNPNPNPKTPHPNPN